LWAKLLAALAVVAVLLVALVVFFPWDLLRGPLNRYVSEKTGRHFEITRKLDVKLGRTTRVLADGIEFANPEWAKNPYLVKAERAEIHIKLLPLLNRHIELPLVELRRPKLGLQVEADGRRSWALGRDTADPRNMPDIGALVVDEGSMHFVATHHGADIHTEFTIQGALQPPGAGAKSTTTENTGTATSTPGAAALPLSFKARGTWENEPFTAQGRTGNVLYFSAPLQRPFPLEIEATAGATTLRASGTIASLATLEGADAAFNLQGRDLADLYQFTGMVLPATPRYSVRGKLSREGEVWHVRQIDGKLGNSDLNGELAFDRARAVPLLTGNVHSRTLDFDDLAPLVGLPEQPRSAAALPQVPARKSATARARNARAARGPQGKVLPTVGLDLARLKAMEADVRYAAARVTHARQLPIDRMSTHVRLKDGVLKLDPLNFGIAGGTLAGRIRIDGKSNPAVAEAHLDARSIEVNELFPRLSATRASFGKFHGDIDLKGRGNSVAQMLGTSSGIVALLMGRGQISNLLLEMAGIDGAEIIKFILGGDRNVTIRCAAAAFDVSRGLMAARALVLDTTDTVVYGHGNVSLAAESMDLTLRPYPKDMSILSLRSPLKVEGTFAEPRVGPDRGALAGRAGLALALGAVNPLLALAATVETGPGQNANCGPALREAASPYAAARIAAMSRPPEPQKANVLGGPQAAPAAPAAPAGPAAPGADRQAGEDKRPAMVPGHAPVPPGQIYGP
jgi:hypothetical protein